MQTEGTERHNVLLVSLTLIISIIWDYLFFEHQIGVSYPVFAFIGLAFFYWTWRDKIEFKPSFGWFLLIPIVMLSLAFALYSNMVLAVLNFLLIPFLMICHTNLITGYSRDWSGIGIIIDVLMRSVVLALTNIRKPIESALKRFSPNAEEDEMNPALKFGLVGLFFILPLFIIVMSLLSEADMSFNYYVGKFLESFDFALMISQMILILIVFTYVTGYFFSFHKEKPEKELIEVAKHDYKLNSIIITTLTLLNIMYLLFSIIQFSHLYGGPQQMPNGIDYVQYVHSGFFQLVWVAVINLSLILASMRLVSPVQNFSQRIIKILCSLMIAFTVNMLFSSAYKMYIYCSTFGLTYLRSFVWAFIITLFVLLMFTVWKLWYEKLELVKCYIVILLIAYVALNYANIDVMIAKKNTALYRQTGHMDIYYLATRSYDTMPYVVGLLKDYPELDKKYSELLKQQSPYEGNYPTLKQHLETEKKSLHRDTSWQAFNRSKYRARKALADL
ncbi:MAG: DUF4153 domain-containing protein [Acidobacteriota bacterium]